MKYWHFRLIFLVILEILLALAYRDLVSMFPGMVPLAPIMVLLALFVYRAEIIMAFLLLFTIFSRDKKSSETK